MRLPRGDNISLLTRLPQAIEGGVQELTRWLRDGKKREKLLKNTLAKLRKRDKVHTLEIMKRHASVMAPKFECVAKWLNEKIAPLDIAHWTTPKGGYFVSLYAMPGTAQRIWKLCKEAGVVLTNAGAAYPYRNDPQDSHLRIAPSLPPVNELEKAMEVLTISMKLSALEKLLK